MINKILKSMINLIVQVNLIEMKSNQSYQARVAVQMRI